MKKITQKTITEKQKEEWFDAVYTNDIKTVQRMIEEGFDVNIQNKFGETALHYASYCNHIEIAKFLMSNDAGVNILNEGSVTPLHLACCYGYIKIAKLLINNGATITARDIDGDTPLDDLKARHPQQYEELMVWLAEHHPDKMLELMASDNSPSKGVGL